MYVTSKIIFLVFFSTILVSLDLYAQTTSDPCAFTRPTCDPNTYQDVTETDEQGNTVTRRITIPNGNRGCAIQHSAYNTAISQCQASKTAGNTTANYDAKSTLGAAPVNNCGPQPAQDEMGGNVAGWYSCNQQYQQQLSLYNTKKAILDQQTAAVTKAQDEENKKKMEQAKATADSFAANQNNTQKGDMLYKIVSAVTGALGAMEVAQGVSCASSCPYGCCPAAPAHFAKAAAYFALMAAAQSQSQRMNKSNHDSCMSYNAVASDQRSCGPTPAITNPIDDPSFPANTLTGMVGADGKCLPTAPPSCKDTVAEMERRTGMSIKDLNSKLNGFANGKGAIKFKDGKIVLPNGKSFTPEELMTPEGLKAAGLSAAEASAFLAKNKDQMGSFSAGPSIARPKIENANSTGFEIGGSGSNKNNGKAGPANGNAKGDGKTIEADRDPAGAEGLAKDFYGELIGVAGDDIFKMMNRRYKLKTAQDSFIGQ